MRIHGGNIYNFTEMLDFSANINPLGMPDSVYDAIIRSAADCVRYPDPDCIKLTTVLANYEHIAPAQIVCGNGAADLIDRIVRAFRPKRALLCAPTFSEYAYALQGVGCEIREFVLAPEHNYQLTDGFLSAISDDLDMVFLCTPNNPTCQRIPAALLYMIADKCRKYGVLLVSDECFLRFSEDAERYSLRPFLYENCIILNAFTKLYAIPGLRLGYALCGCAGSAACIRQTGQFWSVSVPAQAAGIAALQTPDWVSKTVCYVAEERQFLTDELRYSGLTVYDSSANFLLIKAPTDFADRMDNHKIIVRRCTDFSGLTNEHFRIAVRTHTENLALTAAVREEYK